VTGSRTGPVQADGGLVQPEGGAGGVPELVGPGVPTPGWGLLGDVRGASLPPTEGGFSMATWLCRRTSYDGRHMRTARGLTSRRDTRAHTRYNIMCGCTVGPGQPSSLVESLQVLYP
jgi:hypothetical protein